MFTYGDKHDQLRPRSSTYRNMVARIAYSWVRGHEGRALIIVLYINVIPCDHRTITLPSGTIIGIVVVLHAWPKFTLYAWLPCRTNNFSYILF